MDDTMKMILDELKEIKTSQAVAEREIRKSYGRLTDMEISNIANQNHQAVMEQGINRIRESLEVLQADVTDIKNRVVKLELTNKQ